MIKRDKDSKPHRFVEINAIELQGNAPPSLSRGSSTERLEYLSDQLANVVVFPKVNHLIANENGIFVPQSLLGEKVEIKHEVRKAVDGSVQVIICSHPRDRQAKIQRSAKLLDCAKELRWLAEHRDEYAGQWVALDGDKLVSSSPNAKDVYEAVKKSGTELPLIVQVEASNEPPFGGW